MDVLYYEAHVTIEPVFDARLERLRELCAPAGFKVAELFMQKRPTDTPERSRFDTFCTGHSKRFEDLNDRTMALVEALKRADFKVWRYKIEATLVDTKQKQ